MTRTLTDQRREEQPLPLLNEAERRQALKALRAIARRAVMVAQVLASPDEQAADAFKEAGVFGESLSAAEVGARLARYRT